MVLYRVAESGLNLLLYLCTMLDILNEEEVYLQISVSQYRLMWTYKYNITQNKTWQEAYKLHI